MSRDVIFTSVAVEDPSWTDELPDLEEAARAWSHAALAAAGAAGPAELTLVFGDDTLSGVLNRQWRGREGPTDVLSFALEDTPSVLPPGAPRQLGDVVLARGVVAQAARARGVSLRAHTAHLVVHGVLHLCGFDHKSDEGAAAMEEAERRVLSGFGVADPYLADDRAEGHPS